MLTFRSWFWLDAASQLSAGLELTALYRAASVAEPTETQAGKGGRDTSMFSAVDRVIKLLKAEGSEK